MSEGPCRCAGKTVRARMSCRAAEVTEDHLGFKGCSVLLIPGKAIYEHLLLAALQHGLL